MGDTVFGHWMPRMVVAGVDMNDVLRIRSTNPTWGAVGRTSGRNWATSTRPRGDAELAKGHTLTAGAAYRMANLRITTVTSCFLTCPQLKRELMLKSMAVLDKRTALPALSLESACICPCDQWQIPLSSF